MAVHIVWPVTEAGRVKVESLRTGVEVRQAVTALVKLSAVLSREQSRHLRAVECLRYAEVEKQRESKAQHYR